MSLLDQSLETIKAHVKAGNLEQSFSSQLTELIDRLFVVLNATQVIHKHRDDHEMTADLYYQISIGYTDSPELRASYLRHLFNAHKQDKNWEESAQAVLAKVILIVEYLNASPKDRTKGFPKKEDFIKIFPNILRERPLDLSSKVTFHPKGKILPINIYFCDRKKVFSNQKIFVSKKQ